MSATAAIRSITRVQDADDVSFGSPSDGQLLGFSSSTSKLAFLATIPSTQVTGLGTAAALNAGSAGGVATLDGGGKLTSSQLPAAIVGAVVYQGTWNASTNTPALASGTGAKGNYYKVSVAGTTTIDGISAWAVGDTIIFDGSVWDKIGGTADAVSSFNGRFGAVTPQTGDYTAALVGLGNVANVAQAPATRTIATTAPLTGGGDLSADRDFAMPRATASTDGFLAAADFATFAAGAGVIYAPLTNGDADAPALVFNTDGGCIMVLS